MRLLIDTQALLWFCEGNVAMSARARAAMEDQANERFVSHATAWEIAIKLSLGKLKLQIPFEDFFPGVLMANGFYCLEPDFRHYRTLLNLPFHHRDPFDRLLVAQTICENLTLLTNDQAMGGYGIPLIW